MRMTKQTLEHLQQILTSHGFEVRYERGHFKGGYCLVLQRHMVIVNKFHPIEGRIQALAAVIDQLDIDLEKLTDPQKKLMNKLNELTT